MTGNTGETKFLYPVNSTTNSEPLFAEATGSALFFNYSENALGSLTTANLDILVNGGVATAISNAEAIFIQNPTFTDLFTESIAVGEDGAFEVKSISEAKVISSFDVAAGKTFSFNFAADLDLTSKEIENANTEYSKASSKTTFLVLDISNGVQNPKLLDFFGLTGNLISSQFTSIFNTGNSNNVYFDSSKDIDINGNNGIDYIDGFATGNYQRYFGTNTKLAIIEMNSSLVKLRGDTLINNLGKDVKYGTIWDDDLKGTQYNDKIYASLGDDTVKGYHGNDIIEGAGGNDWLYGGDGRDSIYGGTGDDYIDGGYGLDYIDGGDGYDTVFYGDRFDNFSLDLATGVLEFSYTGNKEKVHNIEKVIASRGNDNIYGSQDSNHLEGNDGNDYIKGVDGNNVLIGGDGSDTVIGGNGQDKIIGTDSYNAGFYEQDYLQGGSGGDVFVLGDANRAYYIRPVLGDVSQPYYATDFLGFNQFAIIYDFAKDQDTIQLNGKKEDYLLFEVDSLPIEGVGTFSGELLFSLQQGIADLVSLIVSTPEVDLSLSDDYFQFVGSNTGLVFGGDIQGLKLEGTDEVNDIMIGVMGDDELKGKKGDDSLYGLAGNDKLEGEDGDDTLYGGGGADELKGGDDNDTFVIEGYNQAEFDIFDGGNEELDRNPQGDTIVNASSGDVILNQFKESWDIETFDGGGYAILGNDANNSLDFRKTTLQNVTFVDGGAGEDEIKGSEANETFKGGADKDKIEGEDGNDNLFGDAGTDELKGGKGNDILDGGADVDKLKGEKGNDTLIGGTGDDELDGDEGNDWLIGVNPEAAQSGFGEIDELKGGDQSDTFVLGDAMQAYYLGQGNLDYGLIDDFDLNESDVIQLYGIASNYNLKTNVTDLPKGTAIFFGEENDLIGIVKDVKGLSLTDSNVFTFVV